MRTTLVIISVVGAFSAFHPAEASAQEPERRVSMPEALRLFGENSLGLRIARAELLEIEGAARQSRAYFNPSFTVVWEDLARGGEDYWETTVGVQQRLEWPGRTTARSRAAGHRVGAANAGYRADSLRLAFDVRRAYAEAWAAEEREVTLGRAADVILRVSAAAESRLAEGDISGYEARRLRVERARVEQDVAVARLEAGTARRTLATLVLPEAATVEVGPSEPLVGRPQAVTRDAALNALATRPDIEAAERALDAANAELSVAAAGWVPDPTLTVGFKDQADGFSGAVLGLSVPIPLFNRQGGARDGARARREVVATGLALRRREARNDVLAAFERYESTRGRLESVGEGLFGEADLLLETAGQAYAEGELSLVELLDAARAFREARTIAVALRAATWTAYYDLLRAMGRAPEEDR